LGWDWNSPKLKNVLSIVGGRYYTFDDLRREKIKRQNENIDKKRRFARVVPCFFKVYPTTNGLRHIQFRFQVKCKHQIYLRYRDNYNWSGEIEDLKKELPLTLFASDTDEWAKAFIKRYGEKRAKIAKLRVYALIGEYGKLKGLSQSQKRLKKAKKEVRKVKSYCSEACQQRHYNQIDIDAENFFARRRMWREGKTPEEIKLIEQEILRKLLKESDEDEADKA